MKNQINVNITPKSVALVLLTLIAIYFVSSVIGLVFLFILAYILATALNPITKWLHKIGIPLALSSLLVILIFLTTFVVTVGSIVPIIADQTRSLYENRAEIVENLEYAVGALPPSISEGVATYMHDLPTIIGDYLVSPRLLNNIVGVLAGFGGLILFFVVTVYILIDQSTPASLIKKYWPKANRDIALDSFKAFDIKISQWIRGQIILSLSVGIMSYIGLKALGVPYAELLAVIAAITELIPYIGPWIGGLLAGTVALTVSPLLAVYVGILYVGIQQLESAILVPRVMKKAVDLSPVAILFIVTAGLALFGIWGAIITIPIAAGTKAAIDAYLRRVNG